MSSSVARTIKLESLGDDIPVIPEEAVGFYMQNCMVCFFQNDHRSGVELEVFVGDGSEISRIEWEREVSEQLLAAYADLVRATDNAAIAVALLLVRELTEYTAIEQSAIGTTIDYYLAPRSRDATFIFNRTARLEVSGILRENNNNTVDRRIQDKIRRLRSENGMSTFIVVTEFSRPWSKMVQV